jgi:cell division protein FtsZ
MSKTSFVTNPARIKVVGLGGAGCNAVTRMVREQVHGVEFIAMNTDTAHLEITEAPIRIGLGERLTHGLGAGGDANIGRRSAEESAQEIERALNGADMIFLVAGMGGGTGTGGISVVADIAKKMGALTIGIVTKPFSFEGIRRMQVAEDGIAQLIQKLDTLIIVANDRILGLSDKKTAVDEAFRKADEITYNAVQAIAEVITVPGLVNLDFADVKSIMKEAGPAWISTANASGQNRSINAAQEALTSPLLDVDIQGAKGVLFYITGGQSLTLFEVSDAAKVIGKAVDPQANIIFGVKVDPAMGNEIKLTLIATGFISRDQYSGAVRDKETTELLKKLSPDDLDMPAYLRLKKYGK